MATLERARPRLTPLPGVEKLRFFLDQDSGMRAAFLSAFQPEIAARRADAFYVRIQRELTINQKRAAVAASHSAFEAARRECPDHYPTLESYYPTTIALQFPCKNRPSLHR